MRQAAETPAAVLPSVTNLSDQPAIKVATTREEQLKQSVDEAVKSLCDKLNRGYTQDFMEALTFYSKLWTYSAQNQLLIRLQRPDASHVAGYGRWKSLGRQVKKGAQGIWIWAPMLTKREQDNGETVQVLVGFRPTCVFAAEDLIDFEERPLPELWPTLPDDVNLLYHSMVDKLTAQGIKVSQVDLPGTIQGMCNSSGIYIRKGVDSRNRLAVLFHELAHHLAHLGANDDKSTQQRELEAEGSAHIVLHYFGIEHDASANYLTNWKATPQTLIASLGTINKIVKQIVRLVEGESGVKELT